MGVGLCLLLSEMGGVEVVAEARDGHEALRQTAALRPDIVLLGARRGMQSSVRSKWQQSSSSSLGIWRRRRLLRVVVFVGWILLYADVAASGITLRFSFAMQRRLRLEATPGAD